MSIRELANTGKRLTEGYRLLFGIGAVAVVIAQTVLTSKLTGWAVPWLGGLALTVAVLGALGMLSSPSHERPARLWLAWALGCAAGLASSAIIAWRAEVEPAIAWPTATLAGIATAVLVAFSETAVEDRPTRTANASPATAIGDAPARRQPAAEAVVRTAVTLVLAGATLAFHAWQIDAGWYQPTRIVVGSLYVIVVPGWHLSRLFDGGKLDFIERSTLAVALSLVTVPLGLMWTHFLGARIDFWTIWALVLALVVISILPGRVRLLLSAIAQERASR